VLAELPPLPTTTARPTADGIALGTRTLAQPAIALVPSKDASLTLNGKRYRGQALLRRTPAGKLDLLNVLPVDQYLYSVLGSESYRSWPPAALEAQAIAARSYAFWRMATRRDVDFDVFDTVLDQNYLGLSSETPEFRAAVDRTAGVVLLYQMKLFRCYYHSTCGGQTEAVDRVFPDPPLLPLSGTRCGFCTPSNLYHWRREIAKAEVAAALRRAGVNIQDLASLEVTQRTPSGRAGEIVAVTSDGRRLAFPGADFRLKIGAQHLPSTCFQLQATRSGYLFEGRGCGHGVGMCQWGARGMAAAGRSATEIVRHYYPGAELQRLADIVPPAFDSGNTLGIPPRNES
jgi:stage II sporulation protein D